MRRRALLKRTGVGVSTLALASAGLTSTVSADEEGYAPLGSVDISRPAAAEAVLGPDSEVTYVAAFDGYVTVDVSDPTDPQVMAEVSDVGADRDGGPLQSVLDVKVSGDDLLVSGAAQRGPINGIQVYDVSDPANPTPRTEFHRTTYSIHNTFFDGDHAYVHGPGGQSMVVFDVSGSTPEEVSRWSPLDVELDGVEGWSDKDELGLVSGQHDIFVQDGVAYCAYWDAGTWMVDVSDPTAPKYLNHVAELDLGSLLGLSEKEAGQWFLEAPGNAHYAAVNDDATVLGVGAEAWDVEATTGGGPGGIDLWDISDPSSPEKLSTILPERAPDLTRVGTWTTAHNFEFSDGRLYSSWYDAGVKVHDVSDPSNPELLSWWRDPEEAMFFTARPATGGEFFVASSMPFGGRDRRTALYTFPDRAGQQESPPEVFATSNKWDPQSRRTQTGTPTETETSTTQTTTRTATGTPTETATATPTGTTGEDPDGTTTDSGGQGMPGFGIGAAVAGLGLGAYRYVRRDGGE
jgi:PGF-CTERM protein